MFRVYVCVLSYAPVAPPSLDLNRAPRGVCLFVNKSHEKTKNQQRGSLDTFRLLERSSVPTEDVNI